MSRSRFRRGLPPRLVELEARTTPTTFTVSNAAESGAGSLRQAILSANAAGGADDIAFDSSFFNAANPRTITLAASSGQLVISEDLTINGPGKSILTVSGGGTVRVFSVANPAQVVSATIKGITITGGNGTSDGTTVADGGGIFVAGGENLTLEGAVVTGNTTTQDGGGIGVAGISAIAILNCTISGNSAVDGGGVYFFSGGSLLMENSTVSGNVSTGSVRGGGGIYFFGAVEPGGFTVRNSTIAGNTTAGSGGGLGIFNLNTTAAPILLQNCTITGNAANTTSTTVGAGGGGVAIFTGATGATAVLNIDSTIISGNTATAANGRSDLSTIDAAVNTINFSAIGDADGFTISSGSQNLAPGAVLNLLPLSSNGGPTQTMPLGIGSKALDAGSNPASLTTDQRGTGFPRIVGPAPDIGAFEGVLDVPTAAGGPFADITGAGGTTYTFTITYSGVTPINVSSLDNKDLRVTGPGGYDQLAEFLGVDVNTNGSPRTGTYRVTAPGGVFDPPDNGKYTIALQAAQVFNTIGGSALAATIGTFNVGIPAKFSVTNLLDNGAGSLRQAILNANASVGVIDIIAFQSGLTGTIPLATSLTITDGVTIVGPGASVISVSGGGAVRPFTISGPDVLVVSIAGLTITGGAVTGDGGGINFANENLTLDGVVVTGNVAKVDNDGGGIADTGGGILTVRNSTISGNSAGTGGGIYFFSGGSLLLENSTVSGNSASGVVGGGGLYFFGVVAPGGLTIRNSTITSNTAINGGGVDLRNFSTPDGPVLIHNCTITGNVSTTTSTAAGDGGGGLAISTANIVTVTIVSSILSGNASDAANGRSDIAMTPSTTLHANFSAIGDADGFTLSSSSGANLPFNADLKLGPLQNLGGPTLIHPLLSGSPAANAGNNQFNLTTDQRGAGFPRTLGGQTDIGAFESNIPGPTVVTGFTVNAGNPQRSRLTTMTVSFSNPVNALPFANGLNPITLTRTLDSPATIVRNSATGANGKVLVGPVSGMVTTLTLTFANADGSPVTAGVEHGSLADGRWQLALTAFNFQSTLNDPTLRRLFGDADADGTVDGSDLGGFGAAFGSTGVSPFDFNNDLTVDALDFGEFGNRFGVTL